MDTMTIYHGSLEIVREPEIRIAKFKYPTHQISFHTARALETLKFIEGVLANGKE